MEAAMRLAVVGAAEAAIRLAVVGAAEAAIAFRCCRNKSIAASAAPTWEWSEFACRWQLCCCRSGGSRDAPCRCRSGGSRDAPCRCRSGGSRDSFSLLSEQEHRGFRRSYMRMERIRLQMAAVLLQERRKPRCACSEFLHEHAPRSASSRIA